MIFVDFASHIQKETLEPIILQKEALRTLTRFELEKNV